MDLVKNVLIAKVVISKNYELERGMKMLIEKFREDDLFCPKCHCPQEGTNTITKTEGNYKCEICGEIFQYSYNKLNGEWLSFEEK